MSRPPAPGTPSEAATPCTKKMSRMLLKFCTIRCYGSWLVGVNLQCAVDDALDLVHDVVLGEQMLEIPEQDFLPICFFKKKWNLFAGSPGKAMVARQ